MFLFFANFNFPLFPKLMPNFWHLFTKQNNSQNLSNFVSLSLKLDNPYYHIGSSSSVDMNIFAERYPMLPIEYEKHLDKIGQNGTIVCSHQVRKMSSKGTFINYIKQFRNKSCILVETDFHKAFINQEIVVSLFFKIQQRNFFPNFCPKIHSLSKQFCTRILFS